MTRRRASPWGRPSSAASARPRAAFTSGAQKAKAMAVAPTARRSPRRRAATMPMSSRKSASRPGKRVSMNGFKGAERSGPQTKPMSRLPRRRNTEPLSRASRPRCPQSIFGVAAESVVRVDGVAKRRARITPMMIAGDSMSAMAATMWPENSTPRWVRNPQAVMKVTALTEP